MWKGAIGFGLVSIPVKLYAATEEHGVSLHQVHAEDGGRIRMKRFCEKEGKEVPYAEIAKGYEDEAGRTVVLTDEDLAALPLPSKKLIDVLAFVDADDIDPLSLSRAYYVGAETAAAKPYVLLREALSSSGKAAVTKIALRTRESLALLRVHEDVLVLHTMYWPDEVRAAEGLAPPEKVTVRPQELKMAQSLMETLSEDFDLESMHDEYQHAMDELVAARLEGEPVPEMAEVTAAPDNVVDLMAALQASIDARGGEKAAAKKTASGKAPAKKTAAKKAPAKKTAAKKTAAKKAAPRKKAG
ncbi:Ku protein [Actinacidiphila glaucinigra]|uniref:non-homologous end joining protein Ku n=1 Tax=Actinacidiphila glaucinigra TaxID=235986 RepID=UPI002DD7D488|nr:Ku protein [Actinacidiphila glaucinigra]WSD62460.1 Ku protein [Actinacidiphila glaucinigra]